MTLFPTFKLEPVVEDVPGLADVEEELEE